MSEHTPELLPCPFCSGVGAINCKTERKGFTYYAFCSNCLCCTDYQISPHKATEAWNTREPDPLRAALLACLEALEVAQGYVESSGWTRHRDDDIAQVESAITNARKALGES